MEATLQYDDVPLVRMETIWRQDASIVELHLAVCTDESYGCVAGMLMMSFRLLGSPSPGCGIASIPWQQCPKTHTTMPCLWVP